MEKLAEQNPALSATELSKYLRDKWNKIDAEKKSKYQVGASLLFDSVAVGFSFRAVLAADSGSVNPVRN
jgi:hypothetical protein